MYYNSKHRITKVHAEAKVLEKFAPQLKALQQHLLQQSILPPQTATITPAVIQDALNATVTGLQKIGKQLCAALATHQLELLAVKANNLFSLRFEVQTSDGSEHGEFDLFWGKKGGIVQWVTRGNGGHTSLQLQQLVEAIIRQL